MIKFNLNILLILSTFAVNFDLCAFWWNQNYYAQPQNRQCNICLEQHPNADFIRLDCGHEMCRNALRDTAQAAADQNAPFLLRCADQNCIRSGHAVIPLERARDLGVDEKIIAKLIIARDTKIEAPKFDIKNPRNSLWIYFNTKQCPNCHASILKNGGCNHMHCLRCNSHFCWTCLGPHNQNGCGSGGCGQRVKNVIAGVAVAATAGAGIMYYDKKTKPENNVFRKAYKYLSTKVNNAKKSVKDFVVRQKQKHESDDPKIYNKNILKAQAISALGIFAAMQASGINLSVPAQNLAYRQLGHDKYYDWFMSYMGNNAQPHKFIREQFLSGAIINLPLACLASFATRPLFAKWFIKAKPKDEKTAKETKK